MKLFNGFVFILVIVLGISIQSCSDSLEYNQNELLGSDRMINILIPNVEIAAKYGISRSDENQNKNALTEAEEGKINNLWFYAYPVDAQGNSDSNRQPVCQNLSNVTGQDYLSYKSFPIGPFEDGGYHVYLLANISDYLTPGNSLSTATSENDIKELVLNFSTEKYLTTGNLPMVCRNTEIKEENSSTPVANGIYNFQKNDSKNIFADLTFLCTKIRYTILFDNTESGFSKNFSSSDVDFTAATANNVIRETSLYPEKEQISHEVLNNVNKFLREHTKVCYPDENDISQKEFLNENGPTKYIEDLSILKSETDKSQKAWQGTLYLPENLSDNKTKITLDAEGIEVKSSYDLPLFKNGKLQRGNFYDVVTKLINPETLTTSLSFNVTPWSMENLTYVLHGPYELVVEKTMLECVSSGEWTILGYNSDVDVDFISPQYPDETSGESLFIFERLIPGEHDDNGEDYTYNSAWTNHFKIRVNNNISYNALKGQDLGACSYFYIKAGNLYKKIDIKEIDIAKDLYIDPAVININVAEYQAIGNDASEIEIKYSTNIHEGKIVIDDQSGIIQGLGDGALSLSAKEWFTGNTLNSFKGELFLKLNGLLKGNPFWNSRNSYELTFNLLEGNEVIETQTIFINIIPATTDYIIHFKSTDASWTDPHIFVYQYLTLPWGLDKNKDYEGKTVGYKEINNYYAAPEYWFTNNVAFRGWKGFGGPEVNNPEADNTEIKKGLVFPGGENVNPTYAPIEQSERYYFGIDLNEEHKLDIDKWTCEVCKGLKTNSNVLYQDGRSYPGISMVNEGDGWYKYTLTGIATPGKAMIKFNNGHTSDIGIQYPSEGGIGIPLFDYMDHEGWFLYDGKTGIFRDEKPETETIPEEPSGPVYRFYWSFNLGDTIQLIIGDNNIKNSDGSFSLKGNLDLNLGYYYYDINDYIPGEITCKINKITKYTNFTLEDFLQINGSNLYCAYLKGLDTECIANIPEIFWNINQSKDMYLKTSSNEFLTEEINRFFLIYKGTDFVYKVSNVNLNDKTEFLIETSNGNSKWGSYKENSEISSGESLELKYPDSVYNIKMKGDFKGDIYVIEYNMGSVLYLVPKNK